MTTEQRKRRLENMTPLEKDRGRYLSLYRDDIQKLRDVLTDEDRMLIVDGLFDWFLGREPGLKSALAIVMERLIERHLATFSISYRNMLNGAKHTGGTKTTQGEPKTTQGEPKGHTNPNPNPNPNPCESSTDSHKKETKEKESNVDHLFTQFWSAYPSTCPRKIDKKKCLEKFRRIVCDAHGARMEIFDQLMAGLEAWKKSDMWTKDEGQFICAPAVWLNNSRWEDAPLASERNEREDEQEDCVRVYDKESDWLKCAEDCANCTGNGCSRGIKVPPVYDAHPFPPRDCGSFRPKGR